MLVKVLDEHQVKILVEDYDVLEYNLPFEKLSYDDPCSKSFIYELIRKTYEETGIDFHDCRVMIEVIPGIARSYYVLLSKLESTDGERIEFDKAERSDSDIYIYKLSRGGDVFCFFSALIGFEPQVSELYHFGDSYYIVLVFSPLITRNEAFLQLLDHLDEYGHRCKYRYENMGLLAERGQLLAAPNAYEIMNKLI
ncbi:MAG: adaptor protein MecA [Clostridia bacterium]|nr:adaptor protein MecA [Clostridia bacterium]